jgi:hypothetical protein
VRAVCQEAKHSRALTRAAGFGGACAADETNEMCLTDGAKPALEHHGSACMVSMGCMCMCVMTTANTQ